MSASPPYDEQEESEETPSAAIVRREPSALRKSDPLEAYIQDIQRYPVLPAEEQKKLAEKYQQTGDVEAAAQLVTTNLRLVVKIAYGYRRAYKNLLDLIQEGNIGLMQAVKKYDPYRGVKLSTYAAWWIRAYILRFVLDNWRLVKLGTTQAQRKLFFNLNKEKSRLAAMGIEASPEELAKRLNVKKDEVIQMDRRLAAGDMSLDAPVSNQDESGTARIDMLPSTNSRIDEVLADEEFGEMVQKKIHDFGGTLQDKEAVIFHERLLSDEPRTLQDIGEQFGVSRERIRQLEERLQARLKKHLEDSIGAKVIETAVHS